MRRLITSMGLGASSADRGENESGTWARLSAGEKDLVTDPIPSRQEATSTVTSV